MTVYPKMHAVPDYLVKKKFREQATQYAKYLTDLVRDRNEKTKQAKEEEDKQFLE